MASFTTTIRLEAEDVHRLDRQLALTRLAAPDTPKSAVLRHTLRVGLEALEAAELALHPGAKP